MSVALPPPTTDSSFLSELLKFSFLFTSNKLTHQSFNTQTFFSFMFVNSVHHSPPLSPPSTTPRVTPRHSPEEMEVNLAAIDAIEECDDVDSVEHNMAVETS